MTQRERQSAGLGGFVCCHVGGAQYAIRGTHIRSVARADRMAPEVDGRGRVGTLRDATSAVPVYSLAALFGDSSSSHSADGHIVITGEDRDPFGLFVDHISRAVGDVYDDVCPLPAFAGNQAVSWFDGLLKLEDTACLVLAQSGLDPRGPNGRARTAPERRQPRETEHYMRSHDMVVTFASAALPDAGTRRYALSGRLIVALVQSLPVIPLPGRSPHVKALAWWQKSAVPVLEFTGDGTGGPHDGARYLVARCGARHDGAYVAFRVDADVSLHRATGDDAQVAGRDDLPFLRGVFNVSGECVGLLDLDALAGGVGAASAVPGARVPVLI